MQVEDTAIPAVKIITPKRFGDLRGYFCELHNEAAWSRAGLSYRFVQDNCSLSKPVGTLRGLHFQTAPFAQDKLVQALRGGILDVAVDLRRLSPTYGQHVAVELTAENGRQLLVPIGFAHGFCTLEPDTLVVYKVTAPYSAPNDGGVLWNDPRLAIPWPVSASAAVLSDKDKLLPTLDKLADPFP